MNYIEDLAENLIGLPEEERQEALFYYEAYIYEGHLTDAQAVAELGTPKNLARRLLADYYVGDEKEVSFENTKSPFKLARVIILALFASPILIPVMIAFLAIIFAVLVIFISLVLTVLVFIGSIGIAGVISGIGGILILTQSVLGGLFYISCGITLIGLVMILSPISLIVINWLKLMFNLVIKWIGKKMVNKKGVRHES